LFNTLDLSHHIGREGPVEFTTENSLDTSMLISLKDFRSISTQKKTENKIIDVNKVISYIYIL